ncbi:cytochrome c oxidase assembly protein [Actinomycetes bacterium M1A6_2h]
MIDPLTLETALTSWRVAPVPIVLAGVAGFGYARVRNPDVTVLRRLSFVVLGLSMFVVATCSFVGVYADTLFWVRALQVILLMMVVPFGLAMGRPLTVLGVSQSRLDTRVARILVHPVTTSVAMLATPWLLFVTPWLHAVLTNGLVDVATQLILVVVGFAYFYARLQADPVPRRYSQLVSLLITIVEMLGDGVLGIVLWLGPLVQAEYYTGLGRTWGPSVQTDQIIGAGVFWILGDVLGMPFLLALLRAFSADEKEKAVAVDSQLDAAAPESDTAASTPWWLSDPQLQERFRRG